MAVTIKHLLGILLLCVSCASPKQIVEFCDQKFIVKKDSVYLTDNAAYGHFNSMYWNKSPKKFALGYQTALVKNDTNFVYSIIRRNYLGFNISEIYLYNINSYADSIVREYECSKNGIIFKANTVYKNGLKKQEKIDRLIQINNNSDFYFNPN